MKNNVDLYINGERVEMFDFESINIVDQIQDVRDISKVLTPYSKEFTVPASKTNNRVFKHYYNQNITNSFDARFKISAELRINSVLYKKGRVTLLGASLKNNVPYNYKLVFYSKTVDLNTIIGEDEFSDLQNEYIRQYSFTYTEQTIHTALTSGFYLDGGVLTSDTTTHDTVKRDVIVPFISTNNYYFYDSDDTGVAPVEGDTESRNISPTAAYTIPATGIESGFVYEINSPGSTTFTDLGAADNISGTVFVATEDGQSDSGTGTVFVGRGVYYKDLRPAIRLPILISAINYQYDDINLTGDFFDTEAFSNLYMFTQKEEGLFEPTGSVDFDFADATFLSGSDITPLTSSVDSDNNLYNYFKVNVTVIPNVVNDTYNVKVVDDDGTTIYFDESAYGQYSRAVILKNNSEVESDEVYNLKVYINGLESTSVRVRYSVTEYQYQENYYDGDDGSYVVITTAGYDETKSVDVKYNIYDNMPEIKIIDFLTYLFKMFNLTAYVDDDGNIVIQTLDDFYDSGSVVDITNFVDTSKKEVTRNNLYSQIGFTFEDASTFAVLNSNEITGDEFGNEQIDNTHNDLDLYNILAFDGGTYDVSVGFEKVMYERMTDQSDSETDTDVGWGWLVDDDQNATLTSPFLFYAFYEELDSTTTPVSMNFDNGTSSPRSITNYYRPSNSLTEIDALGQSLHFGSEYDEYYPDEINTESLFWNYWREYVESIYDKQSRIVTLTAYLPTSLLITIGLNDTLIIRDNIYKINKINVDITTGKAVFELLSTL